MKLLPILKRVLLMIALPLWLAISYYLLFTIILSDWKLDFSLQNQLLMRLGVHRELRSPSLVQPMLYMLLIAVVCGIVLIILQFVTEHRQNRNNLTPRWMKHSRRVQVILGIVTAVLLTLIGLCLEFQRHSGTFAFAISGLLALCLVWYGIRAWIAKR